MEWLQDFDDENTEGLSVERICRYCLSKLQLFTSAALRALHVDEVPELRQDWEPERADEVETEGTDEVPATDVGSFVTDEDVLVAKTRDDLRGALQAHLNALGGPAVVTNWFAVAEVVNDLDTRVLQFAVSENMTAWELRGMAYYSSGILERYTS